MKIIIAPDSYKGALRASAAADAFAAGWRTSRPGDTLVKLPLSDGGEGLCEALVSAGCGEYFYVDAHDPLMRPHRARAGFVNGTAVLESAEANGIELLKKYELDPLTATTYGVGEMLTYLIREKNCRRIVVGIGGSATVDGGAGMLQALGAKFFCSDGTLLPPGIGGGYLNMINSVDLGGLLPELKETEIVVACDVTNPLCGANGAAAVFGPQKGADAEMVKTLDANLHHFAELFGDDGTCKGDGAAGGLGFAFRKLLNAVLTPGAQLVMRETGFEQLLDGASLVVTGEGCSDNQTAFGKLCAEVAAKAAQKGVPTLLVSGALRGGCEDLEKCFAGCFSVAQGPGTLDDAIAASAENIEKTGRNIARLVSAWGK